ncbi:MULTISPECIES: phosphopentomutase [Vagococcus]|uniref:Phosphopentomutase like n=1 Tax=Vagococcus fluvialis bH819 TaxID=1255619 RepID=A0A1X6WLD8_9ENTE|nr:MULTISPECIES: phosphopentomutase [Vagococcus]SLM85070.1 Phosphopentomutase like [Vagococcus fluvialis bH819]HCM88514.1 phosphopentomutase [Vagococcus sp.]
MSKFVVIVLDSFGVGAMDDVSVVRPRDVGSSTAGHIIKSNPEINISTLEKLGLMNALGYEIGNHKMSERAVFGTANLTHQGADSFLGHQEIMGTTPKDPLIQPFNQKIAEVEANLLKNGYHVRRVGEVGTQILVVNEYATVGDNLETDYGQVYNVSACLDLISFEELKDLGHVVREVVQVSRVITFGGEQITLTDLLNARKTKNDEIAGVDAPESGVYNHGYQVVHLGYGIDKKVQTPTILDEAGITVSFLGKIADIIQTNSLRLFPGVDSNYLFDCLIQEVQEIEHGFIALNIQETDLAGHAEDVMKYSDRLELSDLRIAELLPMLTKGDILVVMADHGNDPTIGHSNHTREKVPLLIYSPEIDSVEIGERATMADVGATVSDFFNVKPPQHGTSFLSKIK